MAGVGHDPRGGGGVEGGVAMQTGRREWVGRASGRRWARAAARGATAVRWGCGAAPGCRARENGVAPRRARGLAMGPYAVGYAWDLLKGSG
jgi:hypothetical protein